MKRWQTTRTYEFASPEARLVYIACAMAVSLVTGIWSAVELCRGLVARELSGWARKLGAREVETEDGSEPCGSGRR